MNFTQWIRARLCPPPPVPPPVAGLFDQLDQLPLTLTADVLRVIVSQDQAFLDRALEYAQTAATGEEQRRQTVEGKATTIISALGITVVLLSGASGLFLPSTGRLPTVLVTTVGVLFLVALGNLAGALWRALNTVWVANASSPDPRTFLRLQQGSATDLLKNQLASVVASYSRNFEINNQKAEYLRVAYCHLLAALAALVLDGAAVGVYAILRSLSVV